MCPEGEERQLHLRSPFKATISFLLLWLSPAKAFWTTL